MRPCACSAEQKTKYDLAGDFHGIKRGPRASYRDAVLATAGSCKCGTSSAFANAFSTWADRVQSGENPVWHQVYCLCLCLELVNTWSGTRWTRVAGPADSSRGSFAVPDLGERGHGLQRFLTSASKFEWSTGFEQTAGKPVKEDGVTHCPGAAVTLAPGVVPFRWNWGQSDCRHTENTASTPGALMQFAPCLGL